MIEYSIINEGNNVNYLFNNNLEFSFQTDIFYYSGLIAFILNFKPNFCINCYIKNIYLSKLEYIDILNFSIINNRISPIKEIKLLKTVTLLYNGSLELKNQNIIKIINNNNKSKGEFDNLDKKKKFEYLNDNKKVKLLLYFNL